jgi:DHA1 family tetracycline resistance protein-like MFS transporter
VNAAPQTSGKRNAALIFIFVTVLIDVLSFGVIIPVLPGLVRQFTGGDYVQAAGWIGIFGFLFAAIQFVSSPIQGTLSDRYGRRPVILLSCLGLGIDFVFMALAPSLSWLFVGRVISGITAASFPTASAYIADVTPPDQRAAKFGLLGAAFGLGFIIGPALGGFLGTHDLRLPFWVAAGFSLANAAWGFFVLPESLPPERRSPIKWSRANPIGSLILLRSHPELLSLAAVLFLYALAHNSLPAVFVLYADYRYHWTEQDVGLALSLVGICSMIVQAGLVGRVVKWIGERRTILVGLACGTVAMTVYGLAPTGRLMLLGIPFGSLLGLSSPALNALMTRRVGPYEHGQLQGANASVMGLTQIIAPTLFNTAFAVGVAGTGARHQPGAPYLLAALLVICAWVVAFAATRDHPATVA